MNNLSFLRHTFLRGSYSNPCTLTYTAGANGSVIGASPQIVDAGKDGSPVTAVANFNYRFLDWSDGIGTATRTDANVSGNITVTANFVVLVYSVNIPLERGPHNVYVQASDSVGTVSTVPIIYVAAYELTAYGIDIYSGDSQLDVIEPVLHDELLPALPTLAFSCAALLTGIVGAVIRERGIKRYQFAIDTVGFSGGLYQYTCKAVESYALMTAIMALQTAYGSTADAIRLIAPSLNIVNAQPLAQTTYPQIFVNIAPVDIINQLMIQALAQASVRNGNLYMCPLDISDQTPDYHMQRLDPLTKWQKDANIYGAVQARYTIKQYPIPSTVLTLNDAIHWTGTVTDVSQVADTLLPVPSGASSMLKAVGNASRAGLSTLFKDFNRIQFNWNPVTAISVVVSLQQDASNKLELNHAFNGPIGAGFSFNTGTASTDVYTKNITISPVQFITTIAGHMTANCLYRVTLLNAGGATLWQDVWRNTISNTFEVDVPTSVSQVSQVTTVRIEFTNLYLVDGVHYGIQCITCYITVQTYNAVGTHQSVISNVQYTVPLSLSGSGLNNYVTRTILCPVPTLLGGQSYTATMVSVLIKWTWNGDPFQNDYVHYFWDSVSAVGGNLTWYEVRNPYPNQEYLSSSILVVNVAILGPVTDFAWVPTTFSWSSPFNLFEAVNLALVDFIRTGNPVTLQQIVLTFTGDNYIDTLAFVADNPQPITIQAGTGERAFIVPDMFGSEAGARLYANGLLPIISVAREQYTRDVPLGTDIQVGDPIDGDGRNFIVYAIDYRQDGKTIAAGRAMDTLMARLKEQVRRSDTLQRQV